MPKIVHLSSVHPAQDTRILHRECRSLAAAGFEVVLIANSNDDFEEHGVRVRALPRNKGGRLVRMTQQVWRVGRMALEEDADLYHFHDPELIPLGLFLRLRGKPVIYDVHESVSKLMMSKPWIPTRLRPLVSKCYRFIEKATARAFSGIVVATPGIADLFPTSMTTVVQNYPYIGELQPKRPVPNDAREPLAVYIGEVSEVRGALEMVKAISKLPQDITMDLAIAGPVRPESLRATIESMPGADRTTLLGVINRGQVSDYLARASVGLVVLHPEPNFVDSYPVKLFEYMAAGLPVVASNFPFWKQFVEEIGSGVMVDPHDPQAIADGIMEIIDDPKRAARMGAAGQKAIRERFNWESEAEKLIALVSKHTGGVVDAPSTGG